MILSMGKTKAIIPNAISEFESFSRLNGFPEISPVAELLSSMKRKSAPTLFLESTT